MQIPADTLSNVANFLKRYEQEKRVRVYYIEGIDRPSGRPTFFYLVASSLLHDKMMQCLSEGNIPDFAVVAERGFGKPTDEIRAKIRMYYGFADDIDALDDSTVYFN